MRRHPQVAENVNPLHYVHLAMEIVNSYAHFTQIVGQILRHLLGQRGYESALTMIYPNPNLVDEVVDLMLHRFDFDSSVRTPSRAYDLLDQLFLAFHLEWSWSCRHIHDLTDLLKEFGKRERAIVQCGRQAESVFHEDFLARPIAGEHTLHLGYGNV